MSKNEQIKENNKTIKAAQDMIKKTPDNMLVKVFGLIVIKDKIKENANLMKSV